MRIFLMYAQFESINIVLSQLGVIVIVMKYAEHKF
jgi:hypothetical protein